ncbi:energy-coupling factor transport system ATP-binding protein [Alkalibaculum bacchi]|uniref:Energy-coupling factor transport system ATP-binding protein n=1 Tax=Alkalibaculum bacchi TaxID=645887 RepID=A0A366I0I2_9FIRM|nr:energy-coupling factor transport system ATP-binding protein [Alkalibaculum bacchi]
MNRLNFIELKELSFGYTSNKTIIKRLNLKISKDEVTSIVGSNGSGKTTLGKLMMGILKPTIGGVYILDEDVSQMSLALVGSKIGYLFQNPEKHFFTNTLEEELGFILKFKDVNELSIQQQIDELIEIFELNHLRKSSPLLLSQGEKQRLAIATILINKPEYLILDEPTTGLDIERKRELLNQLNQLREEGIGMTVISHDQFIIEELSQRVIKIHRGEIIDDQRN